MTYMAFLLSFYTPTASLFTHLPIFTLVTGPTFSSCNVPLSVICRKESSPISFPFLSFYYLSQLNFFFLLYSIVLVLLRINMNLPQAYACSPSWTLLPPPSLYHPSRPSQCTSPKHPVPCIECERAVRFLYDIIHVSVPFPQIVPPSPSPTESKRLFYTSVSLLLSHIQGYRYHLSKFCIYALVYCIGVFLSGLLHSV